MNQDGVACESCHGPSANWLGEHSSSRWNERSTRERERMGFYDTKTLARRAEICAGCHVGRHAGGTGLLVNPLRDVNHDLIAAGHPRLNFELAAYHDNVPVHWDEKGRNSQPDLPVRLWSVGQAAAAKAALELLADRADLKGGPWPEFTEYGCFSCHHNLADDPWRKEQRSDVLGKPLLGAAAPYGTWYLAMAQDLIKASAKPDASEEWKPFKATLEALLGEMRKPVPDRDKVALVARGGAKDLGQRLEGLSSDTRSAAEIQARIKQLNDRAAWQQVDGWDQAAQRYLALVPLLQAWGKLAPGQSREQNLLASELQGLLGKLRFPPDHDSPRAFDPRQMGHP
jgi:hypothetical protein